MGGKQKQAQRTKGNVRVSVIPPRWSVHVISLSGLSLPRINDVSHRFNATFRNLFNICLYVMDFYTSNFIFS